jgi:Xaa-Pro aminopeptidase
MRKRKTAKELEEIARVAAGTCAAMRAVASLLAQASVRGGELWCEGERLTIGRLRRRIAEVLGTFALEQPERNIVAPAEEGAVPHNPGSDDRTVREGQSLVVDLFPRGRLFADCTRTFCVGEPPENLRRAHAEVVQALRWAHREARPGRRTWELQQGVCASFREAGYPTPLSDPGTVRGYVHSLGHGVGYELHEWPFFRDVPGIEGELELGDVVTLEPGLYDEEQGWAVRLEDLVVLDVDGPRNLTPLPYDLDPRGW